MTDEAMRRQKADVLLECHEAEAELTRLKVEIQSRQEAIHQFDQRLFEEINGALNRTPITERHKEAMNYDANMALLEEFRQAKIRLERATDKRTALRL